ncbi:MAG: winged helix-turn-helix domain-containing protein [Pseudomonadota bacterium]
MSTIGIAALRRHVVGWQRYATRPRRGTADDVYATVRRLSCVQLDSISTVERAHRITLGARIGDHPADAVSELLVQGRLFEFWAHEMCLIAIEDYGLHRFEMERLKGGHPWWGDAVAKHPALVDEVLAAIRERGPLGSRHFDGKGPGGMWNWKPAKVVLEHLHSSGALVTAGRQGFQRLYELAERVIPREHLDAAVPTEAEYRRGFALRAIEGRGALTAAGVREHCRFRGGVAQLQPHLDALVDEGAIRPLRVEDGGPPVYVPADAELVEPTGGSVLIAPFDNLLWDKPFVERLFGFTPMIEVYKPAPERVYGYYVLPLVWRDRIVGRADLKTDRKARELRLVAFHRERGVRASAALDEALARALSGLATIVGAETWTRSR